MKPTRNYLLLLILMFVSLHSFRSFGNVPGYEGKIILVVDQTMATNEIVITNLSRLTSDLVGDGWRVLTLNVPRGLSPTDPGWRVTNGPEVRQVRALIQADYNADPSEVKEVFLIGHVPVPYSGYGAGMDGGHYSGTFPADSFYGEMVAGYSAVGWSDDSTNLGTWLGISNYPADGIFDPNEMPLPMELGVGRLDLYDLPALDVDEPHLISRYLNKDHDFRSGNFTVANRAIVAELDDPRFVLNTTVLADVFGTNNVVEFDDDLMHWFPNVANTNYLVGYGGGGGEPDSVDGIGGTDPMAITENGTPTVTNNFVGYDSRVVFLNLYGSYFGVWDQQNDFLRAPLANPYDPGSGRYGYGLTALWGTGLGLDEYSLTIRVMGAPIGEALYEGYTNDVSINLMGDPTLRMYPVLPPLNLSVSGLSNSVTLTWTASSDPGLIGYKIYGAPTTNGPFMQLNTNALIIGLSYTTSQSALGGPNNFFLVRAAKQETTPFGTYTNLSEGIQSRDTNFIPYLNIISGPASNTVVADTEKYTNNAAAFTVDAVGIDAGGDEQLTYQWYENGVALTDGGGISGSTTRALLISGVNTNDMGNYYVVVRLADDSKSLSTSPVSLTVYPATPTANPDTYTIIRNNSADLQVLTNDLPGAPGWPLNLVSISALSNPSSGTITINGDDQTINFTPTRTWLGQVTFTYTVSDGKNSAIGTVTLNVIPTPGDLPPVISGIGNQQITEGEALNIPFTITDLYTPPDDLNYTVYSASNLIYCINVTGNGTNRILHLASNNQFYGTDTVTLTVMDDDLESTTVSFQVQVTQNTNWPAFGNSQISASTFTFAVNGTPETYLNIFSSADLTNWTLAGEVSLNASGTNLFVDNNVSGVSQRFYKLSGGNIDSPAFGFMRLTINSGLTAIANQFNAPNDTLNGLFQNGKSPDGTPLPDQTQVWFWDIATYTTNTWNQSLGEWLPNGNATLSPGTGAFILNPTANSFVITFMGRVNEGRSMLSLPGGKTNLVSSMVPIAGGLQTDLGYMANNLDKAITWNGSGYASRTYFAAGAGWGGGEPVISVGEGFFIATKTNNVWVQNYSDAGGVELIVPALSQELITSSNFTFNITGLTNTEWGVYSSTDLTNWTLAGEVTLSASGTGSFTNNSISGVPYRFYKLTDGFTYSATIGFVHVTVNPGFTAIADQLNAPDNSLNGLFANGKSPDGAALPDQTEIQFESGSTFTTNTWSQSLGEWLPSGSAVMSPGVGVFIMSPTTNSFVVTFVGQVNEGQSALPLVGGNWTFVSSMMPKSGGLQTALGYIPNNLDKVYIWNGSGYVVHTYFQSSGTWGGGEPTIQVGQGFLITAITNKSWIENYSDVGGIVPTLAQPMITSSNFTFSVTGSTNTEWGVYSSTDLTNWTLAGEVTLNASGTGSFTNSGISGVPYSFYKLTDGFGYSATIGFVHVTVNPGFTAIADQLNAPDNSLNGLFVNGKSPDGTALPDQTEVQFESGLTYTTNTWSRSLGEWLPNGSAVLSPGVGVFIMNPATNSFQMTFVGQVNEGQSALPLVGGSWTFVSSMVPKSGGLQTSLGYAPHDRDEVYTWNGSTFTTHKFVQSSGTWTGGEPSIQVGQGFFITANTNNNNNWIQDYY